MNRFVSRILASVALAVGLAVASAPFADLRAQILIGVPSGNMPLSDAAGTGFTGLFPDALGAIAPKAGVEVKLEARPFARLYAELAAQQLGGAMSVLGTPQRAETANFTKPLLVEHTVLVVPKGKAFKLATYADLEGKNLGTRTGFTYPYLDTRPAIKREPGPDHLSNVRKMLAGRLDAVIIGSVTGIFSLREAGLDKDIEVMPFSLGAVTLGYAFAKNALAADKVAAFDAALAAYLASPEYKSALEKYGVADLVRDYPALN